MSGQANDFSGAPSHKRNAGLPTNVEMAAWLRAGEPIDSLAARLKVTAARIRIRLNDSGWGTDGHPNHRPVRLRPLVEANAQPWADQALCAQTDPESFFPESGGSTAQAKAVCLTCPVQLPCLEHALATDERWGVRGALSPQERRRLKRRRAAS